MTTLSIINSPALQLRLELTDNGSASQLDITLENTLERELSPWCLHLDLQREVVAGVGTRLTRVGSHLQLSPADAGVLAPGATCALPLQGASQLLQRLSDLPSGCFLSVGEDVLPVRLVGHNLAPARQCNGEAREQQASGIGTATGEETARIDALIENKTRFIELLKEKRQALITQAVTKGLDLNVPMRDSGVEWIGEVPEGWSVGPVKRLWKTARNGSNVAQGDREENSVAVSRIETISSGEIGIICKTPLHGTIYVSSMTC